MMKILPGLVSATFKTKTPEEVIALAVKAGLKGIEWSENHHIPEKDYHYASKVGSLTAISGLKIVQYGSYYRLGQGMDFKCRILNAQALGAKTIRIWGGNKPSNKVTEAEWASMVQEAKTIADLAKDAKLIVALEWHKNTVTDTNQSGLRFLQDVDRSNFRTLWQPNLAMPQKQREDGICVLGSKIVNLHIFHWDQSGRRPLSEGKEEWQGYFDALQPNYEGWALLEFVKDDSTEQFLKDAETLKNWL